MVQRHVREGATAETGYPGPEVVAGVAVCVLRLTRHQTDQLCGGEGEAFPAITQIYTTEKFKALINHFLKRCVAIVAIADNINRGKKQGMKTPKVKKDPKK